MTAGNQALAAYTKAEEVLLALWDEAKDNARIILEQALKISFLETAQASSTAEVECAALMRRCLNRAG